MAVFLFSLIGLPLTAGFAGKLLLFLGAFTAPTDTRDAEPVPDPGGGRGGERGDRGVLLPAGDRGDVPALADPPAADSRAVPTLLAAVVLAGCNAVLRGLPEPLAKAARNAAPVPEIPRDGPLNERSGRSR